MSKIKPNKLGIYLDQLRVKRKHSVDDMADNLKLELTIDLYNIEMGLAAPTESFFVELGVQYNQIPEDAEMIARCLHEQDNLKRDMG
jgi:hypothetical protein